MPNELDEFASLPDDDFASLPDDDKIEPHENILQKAAKAATSALMNTDYPSSISSPFGPGGAIGNQFKREMFDINPQEKLANGDLGGYVSDYAKDYFTTPDTYVNALVGGKLSQESLKSAKGGLGKVVQKGKDIATSGGKLKQVNSEIGALDRTLETTKATKTATETELSGNALQQSARNKGKISAASKRNTSIYGETLDEIEERLSQVDEATGQNRMPDRKSYLESVLDKTITEAEQMGLPSDSPVLSKLRSYRARFSPKEVMDDVPQTDMLGLAIEKAPEQSVQMSLDELKNLKNDIFGKTSSGFRGGTSYASPKDKVSELFLRNHGDFMGGLDEEIGAMNKEFASWARARKFGYKAFKPSAPEETQRGANVLERVAGKGKPNADNSNYLESLEKGSGRFGGTGDLRGKTTELGQKLVQIDDQIKAIESSKGNLLQRQAKLQELKRQRNRIIGWAAGSGVVGAMSLGD